MHFCLGRLVGAFFIGYESLTGRSLKHVAHRPPFLLAHQLQAPSIDDLAYQQILVQVDHHLHAHNLKSQY